MMEHLIMAITVETADMKPALLLASLLFTGSALAFTAPPT